VSQTGVPFLRSLGARSLLFAALPTVVFLLGIIIYTSARMSSEVRKEAERSLQSHAQNVAAEIERANTRAVLAAEVMAHAQESGGLFAQREASVTFARRILEVNQDFTATYFGYEPNADGQDDHYQESGVASEITNAHDGAGRFLPYWFRDRASSRILLTPLVDMETSLYYQGTRELYFERGDGHSMVTEPYVYEGKMIVEQVHPVIIDGQFRGIAGVDRALTDIASFVQAIKERAGIDIFLISRSGRFISSTTPEGPDLITKDVTATMYEGLFGPFLSDRTETFFELSIDPANGATHYYATAPVQTGTWTVVVRKLESDVAAPIRESLILNLAMAAIGLSIVIGLSLWTSRSVTRRIGMAVTAADTVASGNLTAHVELQVQGDDEVSLLMGSLGRMAASLEAKMATIDRIAHGDSTGQVEVDNDHDALGQSLQDMADSLRQIVDHAGQIAEGDYTRMLEPRSDADELVHSLNRMTQALADSHERLEQRVQQRTDELSEYAKELETRSAQMQHLTYESQAQATRESSLAALTARLQGNLGVEAVAQRALDEIVDFLKIPAGVVYALEPDGRLHRRAAHALPPEAEGSPSFAMGTGSVGQVAQSQKVSVYRPAEETWAISFGLMKVAPRRVLTIPLLAAEALAGVLEVYLIEDLEEFESAWLNKACDIIAVSIRLASQSREREVAEEQTRLLLESSGEGLFGLDTEGRATFVNPAACEMLGYDAEELVGQPTHALIHHTHADGSPYPVEGCPMREAFTLGVVTRVDDEVLWHKDGRAIPVEYTSTPIVKDGDILGAVISFRDVSERREAEDQLAAREVEFRNLLDSAPDAMVIADGDGAITMVNRQTEALFGYDREELLGQPVEILMPERFRSGHPHQRQSFMEGSTSRSMGLGMELRAVTKHGREFPIEVSLSPIESGKGPMVAAAMRDISERVEAEAEIRMNQERLAALFEALPVGVVMIDPAGQIVQANGLTESILGVSADEHRMRDLQDGEWRIVREDGSTMPVEEYPASRAMAGEGEIHNVVMGVHRPQGDLVWISTSAAPIDADAGGGVAVAFEDITEQLHVEKERLERERRETLLARFRKAVWELDGASDTVVLLESLGEIVDAAGIPYNAVGVNVIESAEERRVQSYGTGKHGVTARRLEDVHATKVLAFWREGEVVNRKDLWSEDDHNEVGDWTVPSGRQGPRSIVDIPFSHGTLAANSSEPDAFTAYLDLLDDIAGVLSEGFRRLDDLRASSDGS
jgi:PAS domain S-box-containing protein